MVVYSKCKKNSLLILTIEIGHKRTIFIFFVYINMRLFGIEN